MNLRSLLGPGLALAVALACTSTATAQRDKKPPKLAEAQGVTSLEYSPDGSFIAMDYRNSRFNAPDRTDAIIGIWDTKTGECRLTVEKPMKQFEKLAISPDGKKLAAITIPGKQFRVWDTATGKVLDDQALPDWKNRIMYAPFLKFSPDGKLAYTIRDGQLFEITIGGKFRSVGEKMPITMLEDAAIDADAKQLVVVRNVYGKPAAELNVYDLTKLGEPQKVQLTNHVQSMAFSRDGKTLAISYLSISKPRLELWDTATWKLRTTGPADTRKDFSFYRVLAFSPDGKMLAGAPYFEKPFIKLVDFLDADGKVTREFTMQSLKVKSMTFSPDGKTLAAILTHHGLLFIDPATGEEKKP